MDKVSPPKFDLHVHTCYSHDCATTLDDVVRYAKKQGLSGVAITDHDTVEGALRLLETETDIVVIPGIEVSTNRGHILGINVKSHIPKGLSVEETVKNIHESGGIAIAAHPSAFYKGGIGLGKEIASYGMDAVEVVNSSSFPFFLMTYLNRRFASNVGLPQTGGSDSHLAETIGLAYTTIEKAEADMNAENVVKAIKKGATEPFGRSTPFTLRFKKIKKGREKNLGYLDS